MNTFKNLLLIGSLFAPTIGVRADLLERAFENYPPGSTDLKHSFDWPTPRSSIQFEFSEVNWSEIYPKVELADQAEPTERDHGVGDNPIYAPGGERQSLARMSLTIDVGQEL